jgi:selenide,water dikinase
VLRALSPPFDPNLLVGADTSDDAAVYRLGPDLAAVATVDYITPVVDDPYVFGAVAAANSLSDVYAMGGAPLFALSLVNFPRDRLPFEVLEEIVRGGRDKAAEAGIAIVGGHSVDDAEPKFGLAVFGTVHPDRVVRNVGARPGDQLFLSKPLGTGILLTAFKQGLLDEVGVQSAVDSMLVLNRAASEAMRSVGVHAATDVTGFGLLGHLSEMLRGSGCGARLDLEAVPLLPGTLAFARREIVPGGSRRNLSALGDLVAWPPDLEPAWRLALADAQTSGGLLLAVETGKAAELAAELQRRSVPAAHVGEVTSDPTRITFGPPEG